MSAQVRSRCPVCDADEVKGFLEIPRVPVYCNVLWPSREEALAAPRGDLDLAYCGGCGHVFNRRFDPGLVEYTGDYENSLHYSPRFQEYADKLAADLIARHDLHDKDIVEIACGKGDFLKQLCRLGGNRGYGFDPSYEPEREGDADDAAITFVRDYYGDAYADYHADFICCRHALEHIPPATEFLSGLRLSVGDRPETVVFFEVPNSLYSLRDLGIWDFIYEHPSYFCTTSLAASFRLAGFEVQATREAFGGQFLCIEAMPGRPGQTVAVAGEEAELATVAGYVRELPEAYGTYRERWRRRLQEMAAAGRTAAVWGGGSKGVTFLNVLDAGPEISCVVDINPHKQGKFVPGTGQPVVGPEALRDDPPDAIIVMNPLYRAEIGRMVAEIGVTADILDVGE